MYEDGINFLKMKDCCFARQGITSLPHIVAIELQYDIYVSLSSPKGNRVFKALQCLDKRAMWGIRLKEGGLASSFVRRNRRRSCKLHVVTAELSFDSSAETDLVTVRSP